ncbi:MAG TPA: urea ABC transporter permease subunit UrtB, partial [Erwinia persicina]|nr:urea ABC transporter permease subunit UrtB [Erwinia persicina]
MMMRFLLLLLFCLPLMAQAGPAVDFAAASRSDQLRLLQQWAAAPDAARLPLLQALHSENVVLDEKKQPYTRVNDRLMALEGSAAPTGKTKKLFMNNRLRVMIASALAAHQLVSPVTAVRLQAARALQNEATGDQLPLLKQRLATEEDATVHEVLAQAVAGLQLADANPLVRLEAVKRLGETSDPQTQARLEQLLQPQNETDARVRSAAADSLKQIRYRLLPGDLLGQAFTGLSLGSVLLLAALGLAITYGLLGVINMAHGEMLMIGAYATWMVQNLFQRFAPEWLAFYPLLALPVAFFMTAAIGMALERT